jgi:hypothetical protein
MTINDGAAARKMMISDFALFLFFFLWRQLL